MILFKNIFLFNFAIIGNFSASSILSLKHFGENPFSLIEDDNFFSNLAFLLLLLTMIFYWFRAVFFWNSANSLAWDKIGTSTLFLANLSLCLVLLFRWKISGHFPLSNLYESLIFLSWNLTTILLLIENFFGISSEGSKKNSTILDTNIKNLVSSILASSALLTQSFATISLPVEMQKAKALLPALQSNWLIMHVTVMIVSYAALIAGCLLSIAFLIITSLIKDQNGDSEGVDKSFGQLETIKSASNIYSTNSETNNLEIGKLYTGELPLISNNPLKNNQIINLDTSIWSSTSAVINNSNGIVGEVRNEDQKTSEFLALEKKRELFISTCQTLDNLSYRILGIGFPFLTLGILSGAVWANEAWGSYWSWDPKETWALLTWLVFAVYLHTRLTRGWRGKKPAIIASLGFVLVWVCFLGVNVLAKGLHSYGWIN